MCWSPVEPVALRTRNTTSRKGEEERAALTGEKVAERMDVGLETFTVSVVPRRCAVTSRRRPSLGQAVPPAGCDPEGTR